MKKQDKYLCTLTERKLAFTKAMGYYLRIEGADIHQLGHACYRWLYEIDKTSLPFEHSWLNGEISACIIAELNGERRSTTTMQRYKHTQQNYSSEAEALWDKQYPQWKGWWTRDRVDSIVAQWNGESSYLSVEYWIKKAEALDPDTPTSEPSVNTFMGSRYDPERPCWWNTSESHAFYRVTSMAFDNDLRKINPNLGASQLPYALMSAAPDPRYPCEIKDKVRSLGANFKERLLVILYGIRDNKTFASLRRQL